MKLFTATICAFIAISIASLAKIDAQPLLTSQGFVVRRDTHTSFDGQSKDGEPTPEQLAAIHSINRPAKSELKGKK
ncbi:hypothetical protein BDF19DRAFT_439728 [Syncephalis fuscata]|nr:hypothetical protein BDF19DRAFT_439728 [Syncephalis fuscata]